MLGIAHGAVSTFALCGAWYFLLSFTSQMIKSILVQLPFPFFISQVQFLMAGCLAYSFIQLFRGVPSLKEAFPEGTAPIDSEKPFLDYGSFLKILPMGLLQSLAKYFSLCATQRIKTSTVASLKALSPMILVIAYRVIYQLKLPLATYFLLIPLLAGVVLMIFADSDDAENSPALFSTHWSTDQVNGLMFCIVSVLLMVTQQIYGKELVTWNNKVTTDPISLVLESQPSANATPKFGTYLDVPSPVANGNSTNSQQFLLSPKSFAKHFTRRGSNVRLPYSVSDLNLNDLDPHASANPYTRQVESAKAAVNPFKALASGEKSAKPDKLTVIAYVSVIGLAISLTGFLFYEARDFAEMIMNPSNLKIDHARIAISLTMLLAVSLCHFGQTLLSYLLLGSIPALTYSIASMMKRIVIIIVCLFFALDRPAKTEKKWFGRISNQQIAGLVLITVGLFAYDRWGSKSTSRSRR